MISRLFWIGIVFVGLSAPVHAGTIEICKVSDPPESLTDPFYFFTIAGESQLGSILVPVDACSDPIALPDGDYTITETADPTSTLESVSAFPDNALLSVDLQTSSATVLAEGGTDLSQEVTVSFVNTPAAVPEPAAGWLLGSGLTVWALGRKLRTRSYDAALRNATSSVVRRALG
jgi:hypothetical protein